MVKKLLALLLTIISFVLIPDKVFASNNYFYDDFSTFNDKSWNVDPNESKSLSIIDGSFIRFNPVDGNKFPLLS